MSGLEWFALASVIVGAFVLWFGARVEQGRRSACRMSRKDMEG